MLGNLAPIVRVVCFFVLLHATGRKLSVLLVETTDSVYAGLCV